MKKIPDLELTEESFLEYLKTDCKDFVNSELLKDRIDKNYHNNYKNNALIDKYDFTVNDLIFNDQTIHTELVFFNNNLKKKIELFLRSYRNQLYIELSKWDKNVDYVVLRGRTITIEKIKYLIDEHIRNSGN